MTKEPYPSDKQDKFMLRLPEGMRDRIKAAADENGRSMNSEIVSTLEEKYPREQVTFRLLVEFVRHTSPGLPEETYKHIARQIINETFHATIREVAALADEAGLGKP